MYIITSPVSSVFISSLPLPVPCLRQDVEFEGEDLEGSNPVKAKTIEVCLEGCRAFNMEQETYKVEIV